MFPKASLQHQKPGNWFIQFLSVLAGNLGNGTGKFLDQTRISARCYQDKIKEMQGFDLGCQVRNEDGQKLHTK